MAPTASITMMTIAPKTFTQRGVLGLPLGVALNYRVNAQDMLAFFKGQDAQAPGLATAQTGN